MPPTPIDYRPLVPDEFGAFADNLDLAFHEPSTPAVRSRWSRLLDLDRSVAAFDGDLLVGTSAAYAQRLSIPGGELACAGVTMVTVRPTHRRRGILTGMMAGLFERADRAGEPISALWAAEGGIYERFGYGVASRRQRFTLPGGGAPPRSTFDPAWAPAAAPAPASGSAAATTAPAAYTIELLPLDGAAALLEPLWERMRSRRPGIPSRTRDWWTARILADLEEDRHGALPKLLAVARDGDGAAQGYAIYRARGGGPHTDPVLETLELIAPDPEAEAALWGYLGSIDLVSRIDAFDRPLDDPLPYRYADFRQPWPVEPAWPDALWLRLLDLPAALEARAWQTPLDLTLEVVDRRLPRNSGRWRLQASADGDARCARGDGAPDLALDVSALGAAYLGGTTVTVLADAGRAVELTPGALDRLDAALRVPRLPWTPDFF
ncbi:MAG TPA: GNAT family N-acetyltransferase [Conexibacter sp.]|nr:GNAT family N-acetyltransferase [Conexibacter sp.]